MVPKELILRHVNRPRLYKYVIHSRNGIVLLVLLGVAVMSRGVGIGALGPSDAGLWVVPVTGTSELDDLNSPKTLCIGTGIRFKRPHPVYVVWLPLSLTTPEAAKEFHSIPSFVILSHLEMLFQYII